MAAVLSLSPEMVRGESDLSVKSVAVKLQQTAIDSASSATDPTNRFQLIWSRPPAARECSRSRDSVRDLLVLIPAAELHPDSPEVRHREGAPRSLQPSPAAGMTDKANVISLSVIPPVSI